MELRERAARLLNGFKGPDYAFGLGVLDKVGEYAAQHGKSALVIANQGEWLKPVVDRVIAALQANGVNPAGERVVPDAGPNAPREDVYRIESYILHFKPDCIVVIGGGSSIDAAKAANVLAALGSFSPEIETYFGTGVVSATLAKSGRKLLPLIAVETAASSGAHLTKYSNITDPVAGQKKLIVDDAIIPVQAVFDYAVTESMPVSLTIDGVLDGIAHCIEVFYGIAPEKYELSKEITEIAMDLALQYAPRILANPSDLEAREALGLVTDLGGYAIMIGGTNGAHLTSFSLVDVASHGRACGIMNPYYTVFFAPAIEGQLRVIGNALHKAGYIPEDLTGLQGRALGMAVAAGMVGFSARIQSPVTLAELPGFTDSHVERALSAAKNPQLEMKLRNMPVPLNAALVDEYMGPILEAARTGDFSRIRNMA